jgi:uncharacterized protein YbaR (Trm112 family)
MTIRSRAGGVARSALELRLAMRELRGRKHEARHHAPDPPARGLVADVGGGDRPHPRADVVVEKYVADNFERELDASFEAPIVVGDGQALPFADGTFAYVIASHVLEHATDPVRFAAELSRIADAGFVQLPSREAELTFGWPFHPWLIDLDDGVLVFDPKGDARAPVGDLFHDAFRDSALLRAWWGTHRSQWHHSVHWRDHIDVRVTAPAAAEETAAFDLAGTLAALRAAHARRGLPPLPAAIRDALRCPACGTAIAISDEVATCSGCGAVYPVVGPTPVLLVEARGA